MPIPEFLSVDEILVLHALQLERFGGLEGLRDRGLLESAVAMPQAGFGEHYVHTDLFEMASAYLYHLVKNHPFIDGNKRVGLHAAYVFLALNAVELDLSQDEAYELVIAIAEGRIGKPEIASQLRGNSIPLRG